MRRATYWPAFTRVYGLHPWDVERMTFVELEDYKADMAQLAWDNRPGT